MLFWSFDESGEFTYIELPEHLDLHFDLASVAYLLSWLATILVAPVIVGLPMDQRWKLRRLGVLLGGFGGLILLATIDPAGSMGWLTGN